MAKMKTDEIKEVWEQVQFYKYFLCPNVKKPVSEEIFKSIGNIFYASLHKKAKPVSKKDKVVGKDNFGNMYVVVAENKFHTIIMHSCGNNNENIDVQIIDTVLRKIIKIFCLLFGGEKGRIFAYTNSNFKFEPANDYSIREVASTYGM